MPVVTAPFWVDHADNWLGPDSPNGLGIETTRAALVQTTVAAWPAANTAIVYPVTVSSPTTFVKAWHMGNSASGNYDVGLYDSGLNKIISTGAIANSAAMHEVNITDTLVVPGRYFVAVACDNATTGMFVIGNGSARVRAMGLFEMATAYTLPSTLTPAATTFTGLPLAGFSTSTVVT